MIRNKIKVYARKVTILFFIVWFAGFFVVLNNLDTLSNKYGLTDDASNEKWHYKNSELKEWEPAPSVKINFGMQGEMGREVIIPAEEEEEMKEKFKLHQFNVMASDRISLNRSLRDIRSYTCKYRVYPKLLPTTSVVIIFHKEAWSTLLRTVWSVINRSPRSLLQEIILVDDASEEEHLGRTLDDYVEKLSVPVYVVRMKKRSGLIRARLLGAKHASGQVITFLDSHCECSPGWLEPLLARIALNRTTVVSPITDNILFTTFEYSLVTDLEWGAFNWNLDFIWQRIPPREMDRRKGDRDSPIRSPVMCGGLFSIDREYFYEVGAYDEHMNIWGGENVEISFRIWQCGGTHEMIPCSRVGHVFRNKAPYKYTEVVSKIQLKNNGRLAAVWMDEWKYFYYAFYPGARTVDMGDISARQALRDKLHCKSFRWYLENVFPETFMPFDYHYLGNVKNLETRTCLDTMGRKSGENLSMSFCNDLDVMQLFLHTKRNQIQSNHFCLDVLDGQVQLIKCNIMADSQTWIYDEGKTIRHLLSGNCLQKPESSDDVPILRKCDNTLGQCWSMKNKFRWQVNNSNTNINSLM